MTEEKVVYCFNVLMCSVLAIVVVCAPIFLQKPDLDEKTTKITNREKILIKQFKFF